jgi:anhydro-N-acetylmuramic acid kinase
MNILGIMSGTSLDGLDYAVCSFEHKSGFWSYKIHYAETVKYDSYWTNRLQSAHSLSAMDILILDRELGKYIAEQALSAIGSAGIPVDLVASHGHTVFHQPEAGFTFQIGNPQVIAVETGILTVGDFREMDVLHGGEGAPLVPVGDDLLFSDYDYCLNLGGFANISYKDEEKRLARDVCPVNIILNQFARELDIPFDREGMAGRSGNISSALLEQLNRISYYAGHGPGSLSREWMELEMLPLVYDIRLSVTDVLRTLYEHIAIQVSSQIKKRSKVLVTGGGAYNTFLIECLRRLNPSEIVIPSKELVEFKEALVFAFLGLLRLKEQINCYSSVTGADQDTCCGVVYFP